VLAVLQFDSASVPLLERLLGDGRLPTLTTLFAEGTRLELDPYPLPLFPSGIYPTLYTGVEISEHGLYSAFPWSAREQRARFMQSFPLPKTVWERIAPRRALVVDPYDSWRPSRAAGLVVSGWQYRNRIAALERWSVPHGAHRELSRRFGAPPFVEDAYGRQSGRDLLSLRPHLVDAPRRVAALVADALARERFDLVWATFSASHFAGHFLWDTTEIGEEVSSGERELLARTIEDVYIAIDRAFASILDALPRAADVIVLSPVGMGPYTSRSDLLPGMLEAVLDGHAPERAATALDRVRALVPRSVRTGSARALPDRVVRELTARLAVGSRDWSATRAFAVPGEHNGYVRLNVHGREREGIVEPSEVDGLIEAIAVGLKTFRDADGGPAVAAVRRVEDEIPPGPGSAQLPDLVVLWSETPNGGVAGVVSPEHGEVRRLGPAGLTGHHTEDAWALVLSRSSRVRSPSRRPRLVDVAATVCALVGAGRDGLPGEPLFERA
jgi:predicted AlkP superfamily phosphohydrolase/phosphomutase